MIEIVGFVTWHRASLYDILRKRTAATRTRAVHLEYVSHFADPAIALGERWKRFAGAVGARVASTWWTRVLEAAATSGVPGVVRDGRSSFGARTLWREGDDVTREEGTAVYDALIAAGLARELDDLAHAEVWKFAEGLDIHPAADPAARQAAGPPARRAGGRAARRPARQAADPAARPAGDPAAGQAAHPPGLSLSLSLSEDSPPLPSPGAGEGDGPVASPPEALAAAVPPPTAGEVVVASLLRRALENAVLRVETPDEREARTRAARFVDVGPPEDRARARKALDELVAAERARRQEAIAALAGADAAAMRRWIARLEHADEKVAIRCAMARKGARADERDQRRAARGERSGNLEFAGAGG